VIRRAHHLREDRLLDCYLAARSGEAIDPPTAEHLSDCPSCGARFAELTSFMDTLRREGQAEADAVFTGERLRAQHQQIARRLEHVGRPARVISFPGQLVRRTITASTSHTAPRWVAAAAAAGLIVGIALGASYEWESHVRTAQTIARETSASRPSRLAPVAARGAFAIDAATDDVFLSELEVALERPQTRELVAFDALTPHVREPRAQR
jgi:hypothetical protein